MTTPSRRSPARARSTQVSGIATTSRSRTARAPRRSPGLPPAGQSGSAAAPEQILAYSLTVRHGSTVESEGFASLDEAIGALKRRVDEIRREGPLEGMNALR